MPRLTVHQRPGAKDRPVRVGRRFPLWNWLSASGGILAALLLAPVALYGQQKAPPWWEIETALDENGCLLLKNKP
jgi:hypothetical protein